MSWTTDQENIIREISKSCFEYSQNHLSNYEEYEKKLKYYKIPVIIISGINSVIAVGFGDYLNQDIISITTCMLSLSCGIIGSIELFLKIESTMNTEYHSGRDLFLLHIECNKMLALDRTHRDIAGNVFLDEIYSRYTKLLGSALMEQKKILQFMAKHRNNSRLEEKIRLTGVHVPARNPKEESESDSELQPLKEKSESDIELQPLKEKSDRSKNVFNV